VTERRVWSYYFIDLRRQYINDRAWFGLGLVAVGFGGLTSELSWWVGLPVGSVGLALVIWGLADR